MPTRSRAVAALVLTMIGVTALAARSSAQDDRGVQRTGNQTQAQPAARRPLTPSVIGCIDMNAVLKGYKKFEVIQKELEAQIELKKGEIQRLVGQYQETAKAMEQLTPGTDDFKLHDDKLTNLRTQIEVEREKAQRDFARLEAVAVADMYKEVQAMVAAVAQSNNMTYVLQISNDPISGDNPETVMAAMMRSVVYTSPSAPNITQVVLNALNQNYQRANPNAGAAPAPAAVPTAPAPSAGGPPR